MRIDVPFEIRYLTEGTVPIQDIIDGLVSAKTLIEEGGHNLSKLIPGLHVEEVQVSVLSISQESPLREILFAAIYLTAQKDLEREVLALFEQVTGTHVSENFETILTLSVLIALFYGAAYVKDLVTHITTNSKLKRQLDAIIKELSKRTGQDEAYVRQFLDENYKPKGKIKLLGDAAFKFFKPSKAQSNAPIRVNDRLIAHDVVSDVPPDYAYEEVLDEKSAKTFHNVELEIHAQDRDRDMSGWAAIPRGVSDRRIKMKLVDGVIPDQLWGRDQIRGDIVINYKRVGTDMVPTEIHLTRVL